MEGITSKRGSYYYQSLLFLSAFTLLGIIFIGLFFYKLATDAYDKDFFALMIAGYFITGLCIYGIYLQLKKVPIFFVTKDTLTVKGKKYATSDIVDISFSGKKDFGGINRIEGMQITFKGNRVFYIYDSYYSNITEIKSFFDNAWQQDETQNRSQQIRQHKTLKEDSFDYYKGGLLNYRLVFLSAITGFVIFTLITTPYQKGAGFIILFPLLFAVLSARVFYYFGTGNHFLIVRSFTYFWVKKAYILNEIREVLFESNGKAPHSITIIMQDYTKKKYYASSLYDKQWRALKHDLESKGINVRDELGLG